MYERSRSALRKYSSIVYRRFMRASTVSDPLCRDRWNWWQRLLLWAQVLAKSSSANRGSKEPSRSRSTPQSSAKRMRSFRVGRSLRSLPYSVSSMPVKTISR